MTSPCIRCGSYEEPFRDGPDEVCPRCKLVLPGPPVGAPAPPKRIGRPPLPADQRRDVKIVSVRVEGAERREKLKRLGRAWLERAIDEAPASEG